MNQNREQVYLCIVAAALAAMTMGAHCATSGGTSSNEPAVNTYLNPLDVPVADPFVFKDADTYYCYGTTDADRGVEVFVSKDLVHWRRHGWCLRPAPGAWGESTFWASELTRKGGTYYLFYTAYNRQANLRNICIATAVSPLGPFKEVAGPLFPGRGFIDPDPFPDPVSGRYYIYAMEENVRPPKILGARLSESFLTIEGQLKECLAPSQSWENNWVEGPCVMRHGDWYYMMYSGQGYQSPNYSVGYATASDPLGPWTKYGGNPILKKTDTVSGPGHNSVTVSPDGKEGFMAYHRHLTFAGGGPRELAIDRIRFERAPDVLRLPDGPSSAPQRLPSGSPPHLVGKADKFDGPKLDFSRWMTYGENREKWKLDKGALVILTENGDVWQDRMDGRNIFLQYAPDKDFTIETRVVMTPQANFEQAFLIVWQDQSNFVKVCRVYSDGPKFETGVERDGKYTSELIDSTTTSQVWLGIARRGDHYTFHASSDGKEWMTLGKGVDFVLQQPQVGLGAVSPESGKEREARFEYFTICAD